MKILRDSFEISREAPGYELQIRAVLGQIWLELLALARPKMEDPSRQGRGTDQIKTMLVYIHEHCSQRITVKDVAAAAYVSQRGCFERFRKNLRTTPMEYTNSYRLRLACRLLTQTEESVTAISSACGMNSSYFCQMFRESTGFTPLEYRRFYRRHQSSLPRDSSLLR